MTRWWRLLTGQAGPGPAWALALTSLLAAFLAMAGPRETTSLANHALRQTISRSGGFSIIGATTWQYANGAPRFSPSELTAVGTSIGSGVHPPLHAPQQLRWAGLTTPFRPLAAWAPQAFLSQPPVAEFSARTMLAANTRLLAGTYPGAAQAGSGQQVITVPAVVTQATAARFGLRPGSLLRLQPPGPGAAGVNAKITGVVAPRRPGSLFWRNDPAVAHPVVSGRSWAAGLLAAPSALAGVEAAFGEVNLSLLWAYPLDSSGFTAAKVPAVRSAMTALAASDAGPSAVRQSGAPLTQEAPVLSPGGLDTLTAFESASGASGAIGSLLVAGLFAVTLLLLLICAIVVTGAYGAELALLSARGAGTWQVAWTVAARSAGVALPGVALGTAVGFLVTPAGGDELSWLFADAVAAVAVAAPAVLAAGRYRVRKRGAVRTPKDAARGKRPVRERIRLRAVAEVTALVAVAGAVTSLRLRGTGSDPYVSLAPVLVAAAAALIVLRLYPAPARFLARLLAAGRSTVGFLGLSRAGAGAATVAPAFVLVTALTLITFGGTVSAAVTAGQVAQSWRQAGADAVIQSTGQKPVTPAVARAIAAVPGVTRSATAFALPANTLLVSGGSAAFTSTAAVLVTDPRKYAALVATTRSPRFGPGQLARPQAGGAIPVLASPAAAAALRHGARGLLVGRNPVKIALAGTVASTPALPSTKRFLIVPSWAASRLPVDTTPGMMLLAGSHIDQRALTRTLARVLPRHELVSRAALLAASRHAPAVRASDLQLRLATAAAALVSAVAVLLSLLLETRERTRLTSWLAALGMTGRQQRRVALVDALPLALVAIAGGELANAVLGPLVTPALDLSALTGSAGSVPVPLDVPALVLPAAGVMVLVLAITAGRGALARRRTVAGVLRVNESE